MTKNVSRRNFLKETVAGASVLTAEQQLLANAQKSEIAQPHSKPFSTDPVAQVRLTDKITTSRIGYGTGVHGGQRMCNLTRMEKKDALYLLHEAYDSGIRFYDCADLYGSHDICAEALAGKPRESYTLGTKIWVHTKGIPEPVREKPSVLIKRFLKELHTDYIDLVQLHCMVNDQWPEAYSGYLEDLEELKRQGLIRGHGVSCHALTAIRRAATLPWVDAMHVRLNTEQKKMDGSWDDNAAAIRTAHENGKGIIIMKVFGEGTIKDEEGQMRSVRSLLSLDAPDVLLLGFDQRGQIPYFIELVARALKEIADKA